MTDEIQEIKKRQAAICGIKVVEVGRWNDRAVECGYKEADHDDPIYNIGHQFGNPQKLPYCAGCVADWPCDAPELIEFIDQVACK